MNAIDLIVGVLAVGLVVFTIYYNFRKKKSGQSGCAYCDRCSAKPSACDFKENNDKN